FAHVRLPLIALPVTAAPPELFWTVTLPATTLAVMLVPPELLLSVALPPIVVAGTTQPPLFPEQVRSPAMMQRSVTHWLPLVLLTHVMLPPIRVLPAGRVPTERARHPLKLPSPQLSMSRLP